MSHVLMWRAADAGGAVAPYRIVKYGDADGKVVQSAAAADAHVGVSGRASVESGARIEFARAGIADIEFGGNVARGVNRHSILTPNRRAKLTPLSDTAEVVPVVNRGDPRGFV